MPSKRHFELWVTFAGLAAIAVATAALVPVDSAHGRMIAVVAMVVAAAQGLVIWAGRRRRQAHRDAALKRAQALLCQLVADASRRQPAAPEFSRLVTAISDELQAISDGRSNTVPEDYPGGAPLRAQDARATR